MAKLAQLLPVFSHVQELSGRDMLTVFGLYEKYYPWYDVASSKYVLQDHTKEKYPADGIEEDGKGNVPTTLLSMKKANSFIQDLFGVDLPGKEADVPFIYDYDTCVWWVYAESGILYIPQSDYFPTEFILYKYQKLDDNVFYLSFSADWRGTPGPEEDWVILPDRVRMLVQRADTQRGFHIKAVLKQGKNTLLPEGFPEPDSMPLAMPEY